MRKPSSGWARFTKTVWASVRTTTRRDFGTKRPLLRETASPRLRWKALAFISPTPSQGLATTDFKCRKKTQITSPCIAASHSRMWLILTTRLVKIVLNNDKPYTPFCSHRGNLNPHWSNRVRFGNYFQMALIDRYTSLKNFEKEKSEYLGACGGPFPVNQRAAKPTRLQYPKCVIRMRGLRASCCDQNGLSPQPFDWPPSRKERRKSMNRPTGMVPMRTPLRGKQPDATTIRTRALCLSPVFDLSTERSFK
jgi:hypothetical protein